MLGRQKVMKNFPDLILEETGFAVEPIDLVQDEELIKLLKEIACEIKDEVNSMPMGIHSLANRINEVGNELERRVLGRLRDKGLEAEIPEGITAGYPNAKITWKRKVFYLEVKLTHRTRLNQGLRTFYCSPDELRRKVRSHARHIMLSFVHDGRNLVDFKLIDLSKIRVTLKQEWNADNKELYREENLI